MAVSILHRATGTAMAVGGVIGFVWWLAAAAMGPTVYEIFLSWATSPLGYLVAIGLTWTFFQHLFSGVRHWVMDTGAGYELKANKSFAVATMAGSVLVTALIWLPMVVRH
jgi:succinate dehydrogenase / fumarate reductase cytochrome b subunit